VETPSYREIDGFPGYQVGDDGSLGTKHISGTRRLSEEWRPLKPVVDSETGYARVTLRRDGKSIRRYVHALVLEAFIGPCPPGMECCHGDGVRTNNQRSNLRWDTPRNNQADRIAHGTSNRGSRQHGAKLRESDIPEILAIRKEIPNATMEEIGFLFGVAKTTIQGVLEGRNWGWLTRGAS
jgi:hypothetical protein